MCLAQLHRPPAIAALLKPSRSAAAIGLYGFILDAESAHFLAHGGCAGWVGRTLHQVMAAANLGGSEALLRRFRAAANRATGGSWMRYKWRPCADVTPHLKGAHCSLLQLESPRREAIAVLCYGVPTAKPPPPRQLPTPPPVAPSRSAVKAAVLALRTQLQADPGPSAIEAAVSDSGGLLGLSAAEALGWEVCEMPSSLAGVHLAMM